MNVKAFGLAAAVAGTMFVANPAEAVFTGVSIVDATGIQVGLPAGLSSYRVYATFDNPGDRVDAVGGDANNAHSGFTNDPAGYFNAVGGFDILVAAPGTNGDSYLAIGTALPPATTPGFPGGGFTQTVVAGTSFNLGGEGVFRAGGTTAGGVGGSGFGVLLGQFTVGSDFGIQYAGKLSWVDASGGGAQLVAFDVNNIPAPGSLALLGLAGLAGTRRRRK